MYKSVVSQQYSVGSVFLHDVCIMAHVEAKDNCVALALSFHFYVGSENQTPVTRL